MSSLSSQDREWVKAMIKTASVEILEQVRVAIDESQVHCPVVTKLRNISIGIGIGVFIAGGSAGATIVSLFT